MATFGIDDVVPNSFQILRESLIEEIQLGNSIGKGANGRVREARWEGSIVAVKEIHSIFNEAASEQEFKSLKKGFLIECERSIRLRHTNIVRFLGIFVPVGARVPSLVMERLYCNLNDLLEEHLVFPIEIKLNLLHGIGLGLRYLHSRYPSPIIHRDLSSKNILVTKSMEAKIADLRTIRFANQSQLMSLAPGTVAFMPPEALSINSNWHYGTGLDIFSFGCVMLHLFSHKWPVPQPSRCVGMNHVLTEIQRRSDYLKTISDTVSDVIVPIIITCLENIPDDRPTAVEICDQLETLVINRKYTLPESMLHAYLMLQEAKQQIKEQTDKLISKDIEVQTKDAAMEKLVCEVSQLKITPSVSQVKQVSKSSARLWSSLELKWSQCASLPLKCWATSIAELDGKVYASIEGPSCGYVDPIMFDSTLNKWFILPSLPCSRYSFAVVPSKKHVLAIGGRIISNGLIELSNKVFLWDEKYGKWLTPYPNMPTARFDCSAIGYQSSIIVAGGISCIEPWTISRVVEVLQVNDSFLPESQWSRVEPLPHIVHEAVPLIVGEKVYFAVGYDEHRGSTCTIVAAHLPSLLHEPAAFQAWEKIPDLPYSCPSISYYENHLITFGGDCLVERPEEDQPVWEYVSLINIYNPEMKSWNCVGEIPHGYYLGKSIHISGNKILFIGGLVGKLCVSDESLLTVCSVLTITPKDIN